MTVHQCGGAGMRTLEIADADVMRLAIQQEIAQLGATEIMRHNLRRYV
jgi:hypothetical protein